MQSGPDIKTYDTEQEVVAHTAEHLLERFRLAYSAPCYRGQLFDDLGITGDTIWAQQILEGTYDYPPDTDIWTKKSPGGANYLLLNVWLQDCYFYHNQGLPRILAKGR